MFSSSPSKDEFSRPLSAHASNSLSELEVLSVLITELLTFALIFSTDVSSSTEFCDLTSFNTCLEMSSSLFFVDVIIVVATKNSSESLYFSFNLKSMEPFAVFSKYSLFSAINVLSIALFLP